MNEIIMWFIRHPQLNLWTKNMSMIAVLLIAVFFSKRFIKRLLSTEGKDYKKQTVYPILQEVLTYGIYFLAFSIFLEILGISSTPIWTMVSAVSVAVGFGAQQMMKDIFSGFQIILESQYTKGDIVEINGYLGTVEFISLRTTEIRDGVDGSLHTISNGEIRTTTNMSKKYMYAVVDIPISYDENINEVLDLMKQIATNYPKNKSILGSVDVLGVKGFNEKNLLIRVTCKTKKGEHWKIERDLRRYFKDALEKENIHIPYKVVVEQS